MASMVAKACTSTSCQMPAMMIQEKGSRNKRKFRADPPLTDADKVITLPSIECTSFEFSAEKFDIIPNQPHTNECEMCCSKQNSTNTLKLDLGLSCPVQSSDPRESVAESSDESSDANWDDLTESRLEDLVLNNLDTIFKTAIKKIMGNGYCEEVATKAILRSGLWYGCKDTVTNIVENTLACLRTGQQVDSSREHCFEDLQQMEKYILAEMVCLLREVRPFFSIGDAMWCLLICDMSVSHACALDSDPSNSFPDKVSLNGNPTIPVRASETNAPVDTNSNAKGTSISSDFNEKPFTASKVSHNNEKFVVSRKVSGITRRDYISRQKSIHFDKHYRSKVTTRSGKLASFGGLSFDKNLKPLSDSTTVNIKNLSFKISNGGAFDVNKGNLSTRNGFSSVLKYGSEVNGNSSLPVADTELSLSFPSKKVVNSTPIPDFSFKSSNGEWIPQERKDEIIMKLVPRVKNLQNQLQEWTEWANQKVMQAVRRLSKEKAELKALKVEKEEFERLKREKQALEDNTMKKLSEMDNALRKASGQVERARSAVRRLEFENSALSRDMEAAILHAARSAASCKEVERREKKTVMKCQSWEKQKSVLQEELLAEKQKLMQLKQILQLAKDVRDHAEARLNQEQKAKDELLTQVISFRKEREQNEISTKSKENTIKLKAENTLQKYKVDIALMEKEISHLRLKTDSSKIAALKRGIDVTYASKLTEVKNTQRSKHTTVSCLSKMMISQNGGVKRERECVMCLSEEMSVVFLPCGHQVVCTICNELHEKKGMKDCPSCRTLIQRRVSVRYARP